MIRTLTTALRRVLLSAMAAVSVVACSGEVTAPAASASSTPERESSFVPTAANKYLYGVSDGTYQVTFEPGKDNSFSLGANRIDIPANSVCKLVGSGYGAMYWNQPCSPEQNDVKMIVVISGARSANSRVDFYPAMRFNPRTSVRLFMYVPNATMADATNWVMKYCNALSLCIDESKNDRDLQSYVDRSNNVVFRRIKHFSGYVVAENSDSTTTP